MTAIPLEVIINALADHQPRAELEDTGYRAACTCTWRDNRTWTNSGQTLAEHRVHQAREVDGALHSEGLIR
jgi:hypothetical protein